MKVLFTNPPWWSHHQVYRDENGNVLGEGCVGGVRAGSRWPMLNDLQSEPDRFVYGDYLPYPFFMGYAATWTQANSNAEVVFRDSVALKDSYQTWLNFLVGENPDYVVFESATPSWETDQEVIRVIHQHLPHTRIILTGPIAVRGEALLESNPIHAVVRGEYDKQIVKVLEGAEGVIEYDLLTKEEMNAAPYPWYDTLHALRYFDDNPKGTLYPHAHVWSSRGCPYKCIFCVWPAVMTGNDPDGTGTRKVRHYSADYMEGFLTELVGRYGYRSIYFDDDTFNLGNAHVVRMCEVMKKVGVPWTAMCRADTSKMETWEVMRDAGCIGVKIGFESGSQYVVDKIIGKQLDLEYAVEVVYKLKELGMTVHGTFTFGLPGETEEQMRQTHTFIESIPLDTFQVSGTAEIDGAPLSTLRKEGELEKYEGAQMDENYEQCADGSVKMDRVRKKLAKTG